MVEKIQLIQTRIKELEDLIYKAQNGKSYADIRWLDSLLTLNKKILVQLMQGLPIEFYKIQYTDEAAKGFFLTKAEIMSPFINVWN